MHVSRTWLLPLTLAVLLGACSESADATAADASAAATPSPATDADAGATADAANETSASASGFVLDMGKIDAYFETLGKISHDPALAAAAAADEDGDAADPVSMDASESVDAYIARLKADPEARRLVTLGGMSVEDFAHTNSAMLEGMMTAGLMEATGSTTIPDGINPQYVEFARTHKAELEAKVAEMQAKYGGE